MYDLDLSGIQVSSDEEFDVWNEVSKSEAFRSACRPFLHAISKRIPVFLMSLNYDYSGVYIVGEALTNGRVEASFGLSKDGEDAGESTYRYALPLRVSTHGASLFAYLVDHPADIGYFCGSKDKLSSLEDLVTTLFYGRGAETELGILEWSGDYLSDPDLPSRWRKCI